MLVCLCMSIVDWGVHWLLLLLPCKPGVSRAVIQKCGVRPLKKSEIVPSKASYNPRRKLIRDAAHLKPDDSEDAAGNVSALSSAAATSVLNPSVTVLHMTAPSMYSNSHATGNVSRLGAHSFADGESTLDASHATVDSKKSRVLFKSFSKSNLDAMRSSPGLVDRTAKGVSFGACVSAVSRVLRVGFFTNGTRMQTKRHLQSWSHLGWNPSRS